jgi:WD40 repeat protein
VEAPPHSRVALTLDGERAILAGADHTVEVRDVQSGAILYQRSMLSGLGNSHGSIAVSEHGNTLFSWVAGTVHLWTLRDGDSDGLRVAENLTALDVSSDGLLLATAGRDGVVRLWDWRSHSLLREIPLTTEGSRDVVFSADGSRLLAANRDGTAHLLDTISGERLATWTMPDHGIAMAGAIYGENTAVVGWETGLIAGFDTDTGAERWRVEADLKTLWGLEISADERWLAASGRGKDHLVELWDLSPSSPVREWRSTVELAGFRVAFSADGRRIAAGSRNGLTHVFDVSDPGPIHVLKGRSESIQSAAFSADGSLLAVGAYDGRLHLYDTEAWDEVLSVEINDRSLVDLAFVPGTKVVLAGSGDGRVVPFDLAVAMTADEMSPQIGIDGDASLSWLQLARIAARQQHWDQVVDRLQQALRGGESVPHLELARAQWASGDRDAARTSLERARDAGEALDATLSAWLAAP